MEGTNKFSAFENESNIPSVFDLTGRCSCTLTNIDWASS
jgi:hypothetical protein